MTRCPMESVCEGTRIGSGTVIVIKGVGFEIKVLSKKLGTIT